MSLRQKVVLIGGGPACMMAAYYLGDHADIHLYEQGKTIGRKFLVAGNGGFNLTNSVTNQVLLDAYCSEPILHQALREFDSNATRDWLAEIGIPTFIGSSGRVFPEAGIKPATVLSRIKKSLVSKGVQIHTNSTFVGFDSNAFPIIVVDGKEEVIHADHVIFGLGGGSWSKTGSTGNWMSCFNEIGIETIQLEASNCGIEVDFPALFLKNYEGKPLKNIAFKIGDVYQKGEAIITKNGLEGNAIYPLIPFIREALNESRKPSLFLDLKPNNTLEELVKKVEQFNIKPKNYKYGFKLDTETLELLKLSLNKEDYLNPSIVAITLKSIPIPIKKLRPIEEAISTVGGIPFTELNANFSLKKHPHIKIIGEMINWDAPTGGYLLQGCFSTGYKAAQGILSKY